jgi:cell division protein FtsZ
MISINRHPSAHAPVEVPIKVVGLGGAGCNALDRLTIDGPFGAELIAINTDAQALTGSVVQEKVQLGRAATHGLGAGGDPEIGFAAAEESVDDVRAALDGAQMVFLCVGLGGGTGSGAARLVAATAREQGALVVAFATLPFTFEGRRRMAQAEEALTALRREADVVICFENDRMGDAVSPLAGIQEAFVAADQTISQSVRAIAALVQRRGLMHLGFDELATALRSPRGAASRCLFGYGEAEGDNRANEALTRALKNPLMDKGRLLDGAESVLVNIAGGTSMTLNEVQILMEALNRFIDDKTQILFGTVVEPRMGQKMSVTILSAIEGQMHVPVATTSVRPPARIVEPVREAPAPPPPRPRDPEPVFVEEPPAPKIAYVETDEEVGTATPDPADLPLELEPEPASEPVKVAASSEKQKKVEAKQEQMQFEPVTRGRFERSEPTIVDGQDLDVPTFMRRNVKVK